MEKCAVPPGVKTNRRTPRVVAIALTVLAIVYCAWGTLALSSKQVRPARPHVPLTPEERSETTLVKHMFEHREVPMALAEVRSSR